MGFNPFIESSKECVIAQVLSKLRCYSLNSKFCIRWELYTNFPVCFIRCGTSDPQACWLGPAPCRKFLNPPLWTTYLYCKILGTPVLAMSHSNQTPSPLRAGLVMLSHIPYSDPLSVVSLGCSNTPCCHHLEQCHLRFVPTSTSPCS